MNASDFDARIRDLIREGLAAPDLETQIAAGTLRALVDLRADLKRRSARGLADKGAIPVASVESAGVAVTGMCFPNYGRAKGEPIAGAILADLHYYAAGARRSLADAAKARFHDKERTLLAAIEDELFRRHEAPAAGGAAPAGPPPGDDDIPF